MMRKLIGLALWVAVLELTACGAFNPQTSEMTQKNQCIALQREILFNGDMTSSNTTQWQSTNNRLALQQQFDQMHCSSILSGQPAPAPSQNSKTPVTG